MGKNKGKKGDSSNATMVTTIAMTGGVFLLRKLMATAWTKVTGRVPPTDLTDPKVTLPEALAWAIATGIVVETARFAFVRSTMRKSLPDTGAESS
jgi:nanoRNase/pAp phosphatase (c-di-AMP/oligoRNAs hydrolase)